MNSLLPYIQKIKDYVGTLTLPQKISYAGGILVFLSALTFVIYENNRTDYVPL